MSDTTRSERPCPVCGRHALAVDEPPHIDVMGVQAYSDMLGMGDLQQPALPGIVCLGCGTRWRDLDAFARNEPEEAGEPDDTGDAEDADDTGDAEDSGDPAEAAQ